MDQRLDKQIDNRKHPRLLRRLGSPRDKAVPPGCKKWMIKTKRAVSSAEQEGKDVQDVSGDQPVGQLQVVGGDQDDGQDVGGDQDDYDVVEVNQDCSTDTDLSLSDCSDELL